jgi:hypothetical protein
VDNPLDSINVGTLDFVYFADLDGDGDKDLIRQEFLYSPYRFETKYYQNIGSPTTPNFQVQTNSSIPDSLDQNQLGLTFVDIDGDGDLDLFTTEDAYYTGNTVAKVNYYKNEGNASSPAFALVDSANNPLQKVANYYNALNLPGSPRVHTHFMDVDGDGDQDCFVGTGSCYPALPVANNGDRVLYYKNEGNVNTPNFQLQSPGDNPLDIINTTLPAGTVFFQSLFLFDADSIRDGKVDALLKTVRIGGNTNLHHFKNTGTAGNPAFVLSATTPLDNMQVVYSLLGRDIKAAEDLTNDGRTEIFMVSGSGSNQQQRYFVDTVSVLNQFVLQGAKPLEAYPNPSTGIIQLEQAYTGLLEVYTTTGQLVYKKELEEVEQLNLELLDTGIYVVSLQTPKERFVQQVTIIK